MPVVNFLTSAASFLYAISSMLSGAQNNADVQQSFLTNFQNTPNHFLPVGVGQGAGGEGGARWRTSKANNYYELRNNVQLSGDPSNNFINNNASYYNDGQGDAGNGNTKNNGQDAPISSTIFFPSSLGGGFGQTPPNKQNDPGENVGHPDMTHPPIEISYHDGETLATLYTDEFGNVTSCEMLEVNKISEQQEALAKLAAQNKLVEKTNFNTMLNIIRACQALDKEDGRSQSSNSFEAIVQTKTNMWTIVSGILPGTKWCGVRDIADGWNDLGPDRNIDKCCRSHDLCPRKVLAFRAAYGLVNWSFYTKSHCECDAEFYDCLKSASSVNPTADLLGNFYFNVLRMQCIDEENPPKCIGRNTETSQSCTRWENDYSRASSRLVFREFRQLYK